MIDWVDDHCLDWAQQYRAMGWPLPAEIPTFDYVHDPQKFTPDAQAVSVAVFMMRTTPEFAKAHQALVVHYLFAGSAKMKLNALGWNKNDYWDNLHAGHCFLAAKIQPLQQIA